MKPSNITTEHPIMCCPVCKENIVANVTVKPVLGPPEVGTSYTVNVPVSATMTRFHVRHDCPGLLGDVTPRESA